MIGVTCGLTLTKLTTVLAHRQSFCVETRDTLPEDTNSKLAA